MTTDELTNHHHHHPTPTNDYDKAAKGRKNGNGVHVRMETFSRVDEGLEDESDYGFGIGKEVV
jgi:hypothetical protein